MTKKWIGPDAKCDICGMDVTKGKYFVDAKTNQGSWALMCDICYIIHGVPIGQKYGPNKEKICDLTQEHTS